MVLLVAFYTLFTAVVEMFIVFLAIIITVSYARRFANKRDDAVNIAFFHPYCLSAGGGERVLWTAVRSLQQHYCLPNGNGAISKITVYTGDAVEHCRSTFAEHCRKRFAIEIADNNSVVFVHLSTRWLIEASTWPRFTMFGQSIGSVIVACEALLRSVPDIFIDSTGFAFTLPVFRLFAGCQTLAYVHYPTISTDMIQRVVRKQTQYNNDAGIAHSRFLSYAKLVYYRFFAVMYGLAGRACQVVLVNSTWTYNHLSVLWSKSGGGNNNISIVYPPCDIDLFRKLSLPAKPVDDAANDDSDIVKVAQAFNIISVAQFRPEKDHAMQIKAFAMLLERLKRDSTVTAREHTDAATLHAANVHLILLGSNRDGKDQPLIDQLKDLVTEMHLDEQVTFAVNVPFDEMLAMMKNSKIAIHTMMDEHFGISVVEAMAAGLITVAHNSAGPRLDIVKPAGMFNVSNAADRQNTDQIFTTGGSELDEQNICGFLCSTPAEYATALHHILCMPERDLQRIRDNAWKRVQIFHQREFEEKFADSLKIMLLPQLRIRSSSTVSSRRRLSTNTSAAGNNNENLSIATASRKEK